MEGTMRAQRLHSDRTVTIEDIPIPKPGPNQVLIKVAYCGICHSDMALIDSDFPMKMPEITQGHECSGTIAEMGSNVQGWEIGDKVIPQSGMPCLKCRECRRGNRGSCQNLRVMAFDYDGAWAQYTVANAEGLTRVPDGVPMEQAVILADAVATPFGAVKHTGKVSMGNAVAVWGLGGVGTHIVQLSRLAGAYPVIGIDINEGVFDRAKRLGADFTFRSDDPELMDKIKKATGGRMIDVAFDAAGLQVTFEQAVQSLDYRGRAVLVGLSRQEFHGGSLYDFGVKRRQAIGHLGYEVVDIFLLAELVKAGRLDLSESVSQIISLENLEEGLDIMRNKTGNPIRIVVDPWAES
ncbi:zinc-binding dehydrogenase [Pauljensenia sp. UMB10120]|uniref:zinc-binding dehydrogenase n=1 Tax=Pauljensenia sp. UMB10120 TaxID=3046356 RepID=UPI00254FF808|nr:zinc-binding dehydrogenase [Pauljensenia sp. UMB10120]MDK6242404.1 zinc-binding dehydrogenase [Pauljensenia sp. UMB10120]